MQMTHTWMGWKSLGRLPKQCLLFSVCIHCCSFNNNVMYHTHRGYAFHNGHDKQLHLRWLRTIDAFDWWRWSQHFVIFVIDFTRHIEILRIYHDNNIVFCTRNMVAKNIVITDLSRDEFYSKFEVFQQCAELLSHHHQRTSQLIKITSSD